VISAAGVLIFAGLTAWDTQRIKQMYDPMEDGAVVGRKAVMGRCRSISTSSTCSFSCCASSAIAADGHPTGAS
jgi:FtsH-binding integral membrane protein